VEIEMNAVAPRETGAVMESVLIKGDLAKLTPAERSAYYMEVCRSIGLNPLTQPFQYIVLNGKMVLYATRACTDQLRSIHKVSVVELTESEREGVYIVTAKVTNAEGRTDMSKGAVTIGSLKGDALANAFMKAETKAKRRATLSLCGLGFLDETEIETIPTSVPHDPETGEIMSDNDANQLIMEARSYAKLGQVALQAHWKSLGKSARRVVNTIMDELKVTATEADAMREPATTEGEI
jgi:hypothetical protein